MFLINDFVPQKCINEKQKESSERMNCYLSRTNCWKYFIEIKKQNLTGFCSMVGVLTKHPKLLSSPTSHSSPTNIFFNYQYHHWREKIFNQTVGRLSRIVKIFSGRWGYFRMVNIFSGWWRHQPGKKSYYPHQPSIRIEFLFKFFACSKSYHHHTNFTW